MTDDKTACLLTNLPLEVRHNIFKYTAARHVKPKKLLRYWFEKKEIKDLIAQQTAADPNGPAPRVVHDNSYDEDSESEPIEDEDEDGQASGDDDAEEDAQEDEDGDEGEDEDGDENAEDLEDDTDQDEEDQDVEVDNGELDDATEEDEDAASSATTQPPITTQAQPQPDDKDGQTDEAQMEGDNDEVQGSDDIQAEGEEAETQCAQEVDEDGHEAMAEENDEDGEDGEDGEDVEHVGDNGGTAYPTAAAPPPPPPPPIVRAARKWRYIPNFMRITHCPPPVELLLASKQLNEEAKNWFYDVAILRIQATGSFAHTSFFEEAFSQITKAAFSPMENIRKVEITFAWDTTWLRADTIGWAEAIFPALLHQRSDFVYQILSQAPDLKDVTIHWHDSAQDEESANFMLDILAAFHSLPANVKIQEHYIAADAKPDKRSIAGKRRLEFQSILDNGLDRLF